MIFPVLLLLGLGAFAAYELVPKFREHVKSLEEAALAHHVADQHIQSSQAAQAVIADHVQATGGGVPTPPSWVLDTLNKAIEYVQVATVANQVAAIKTADAANGAQTEQQRQAVAQSAAAVTDRQAKIEVLKQQLGVGQCGMRTYKKVSARVKDALLARLKSEGMDVTGNNPWGPWDINSHKGAPGVDVMLRAVWDQSTETLYLIVTAGKVPLLVSCDDIWAQIEPKLNGIIGARAS